MIFCYVVLHYKTAHDTIECINSIFKSDTESLIVVVDNASNNGSIEEIESIFKNSCRVSIIKNNTNLGFADGNNEGYKYAKNQLKADYIAISNNDIIVVTKNLPQRVKMVFEQTNYDVMGPDIISLVDGGHQNPICESLDSAHEVRKEILRYRILLILSKCGIYDKIKNQKKVRTGSTQKTIPNTITENVTLHGSFIVFSPSFIKKEEISFRHGTFLYTEEAILRKYCELNSYKMIFVPEICVYHKEDSSTNSLKLSNKERREFVFENMIRSLSVYMEYLRKFD